MVGIGELFPSDADFGFCSATVEEDYGAATVAERPGPDFEIAFLADTAPLPANFVLIDGDDFLIGEYLFDLWAHGADIVAGDERCGQHRPKTEVRLIFGVAHAAVADFQHVWIVPVAGTSVSFNPVLHFDDINHAERATASVGPFGLAFPVIRDVSGSAPKIPDTLAPEPRLCSAPFAHAEHYGAAGGEKSVAHSGVSLFGIARASIAPVVFKVINTPAGILQGVLILVTLAG